MGIIFQPQLVGRMSEPSTVCFSELCFWLDELWSTTEVGKYSKNSQGWDRGVSNTVGSCGSFGQRSGLCLCLLTGEEIKKLRRELRFLLGG